jgi:hypothetical protein
MKYALIISMIISFTGLASGYECQENVDYSLSKSKKSKLGLTNIPSFWDQSYIKESICYDPSVFNNNQDILAKFKKLKSENVLDENNCLVEKALNEKNGNDVADLTIASLNSTKSPMTMYAIQNAESGELLNVVLSNSNKDEVRKNALTAQDKREIVGTTLASSAIGILIERKAFEGQHDKLLHSNYGALINIGTNLASYAVIESLGVGDKLNLSRNQKKMAILLSGTLMGAIVGYAKERFYDYYRQKYHTYDPHLNGDMGATMLGGGAVTPFIMSFSVKW